MAARLPVVLIFLAVGVAALRFRDPDHLLHEAVDHSSAKQKEPHQKDFQTLDHDGDGQLSVAELMWRQWNTGCEAQEAQIRAVDYLACGDTDKSNTISQAEFEASLKPEWLNCVMGRSDRRAHGFMRFIDADTDIDDKLTLTELRVAMKKLWGPPGEQLAKPFIGCADADKDGMIGQDEFHDTISVYNPAARKFQGPNTKVLTCLDSAMADFDAHLAFVAVDRNKDGKISKSEAYAAFAGSASPKKAKIDKATVDKILEAADLNKDGYLNLEEFRKAGESYKGDGESFLLTGNVAQAPLAADAVKVGMGAACAAQTSPKWSLFAAAGGNATANSTKKAPIRK